MRLRTFTASDMPAVMKLVRETLGDGAIILATESHKTGKGVSVTAAVENGDERQMASGRKDNLSLATPHASRATDSLQFEIQNLLRFHNLPEAFVARIMQKMHHRELASLVALHHISARRDAKPLLRLALEKLVDACFSFEPLPLHSASAKEKAPKIMLVGPPGIGKTLTVAKIAARWAMQKQPVAVFTADNKRAGGIEQLQAFTHILELPLHVAEGQADLARQLKAAPAHMPVLIDTAGCNPYDHDELEELKSLARQQDIEPVLVLPAGGDSAEMIDTVEPFAALPVKRLLITRADTARRFGGALAAAAAHRLALCNISRSSSIIHPPEPVDASLLAQMLLKYQSRGEHAATSKRAVSK